MQSIMFEDIYEFLDFLKEKHKKKQIQQHYHIKILNRILEIVFEKTKTFLNREEENSSAFDFELQFDKKEEEHVDPALRDHLTIIFKQFVSLLEKVLIENNKKELKSQLAVLSPLYKGIQDSRVFPKGIHQQIQKQIKQAQDMLKEDSVERIALGQSKVPEILDKLEEYLGHVESSLSSNPLKSPTYSRQKQPNFQEINERRNVKAKFEDMMNDFLSLISPNYSLPEEDNILNVVKTTFGNLKKEIKQIGRQIQK